MILNLIGRSSKNIFISSICILTMMFASSAFSQSDWSKELSARQRFMVFPHVDAGFRALKQMKYDTAIVEFQRAVALAPANAALVGYLAETYAASGDLEKAIFVIDSRDASLPQVSELLELKRIYTQRITNHILKKAESFRESAVLLKQYLNDNQPVLDSAYVESVWIELLALASTPKYNLLQSYILKFSENRYLKQRLSLLMLVKLEAFPQANQLIDQWSPTDLAQFSHVDSLSYALLTQGNPDQALRLLIKAFPFSGASTAERNQLLNRLLIAESRANDKALIKNFLENQRSQIQTSAQEREWLVLMAESVGQRLKPFVDYQIQYRDNASLLVAELQSRLQSGAQLPDEVDWEESIAGLGPTIDTLLDTLTYRLVDAGSNTAAWDLLMARYPFNGMSSSLREKLVTRLDVISLRQPSLLGTNAQARLSIPLDSARLRGLQAAMLKHLGNCMGVRQVLGDLSNHYTASDWMMLGECYLTQQRSGLAQYAFEQAIKRHPTTEAMRALAYVAYQNKNNVLAVQAWKQTIASGRLTSDNWLAATITALAADEKVLAAQWLEQYEQAQGWQTADYWAVKADVLSAVSVPRAISAMQTSLKLDPRATRYAELAGWQRQVGDMTGAIASLKAAIALAPNDGAARADLGFLEYNAGHLPEAQVQMQAALKLRPNDMRVTEQLAYIDQRLGDNDQAKRDIEQSVDYLLRFPSIEQTPVRTESMYALRRMHEDLSRRWTLSVDGMSSTSPAASTQSPVPGQDFKSYAQIEFDYRLGDPAINDGKTVSVYGRVFGGSGPNNAALPVYAPMLGIGLRWKPFSDYVIYLAAEKQIPLDHGTSASANTMLRVSASFLNTGRYSDDWHPTGSGWFSQNLYLDSAYYLSNQAYALTADYRFGYHHKLQQGQTIEPYTRLVATKISSETSPDVRIGVGIRWNIWANQSRYNAYASKYYVGLEMQGAIKTYQNDRIAALLTMGVRW